MTNVYEISGLIHELRYCDPPSTEDWEKLVEALFGVLRGQTGQHEARRIFTKYAKPVTKREAQIEKASRILWRYITMKPKRNVALLTRQIAEEDDRDLDAIGRAVWRALNAKEDFGKRVRDYLREELHERGITMRLFRDGKAVDVWAGDFFNSLDDNSLDDAFNELDSLLERDIFE
jgi:hypothetical protein